MIFGLMLAIVLITHVKKQRNRNCQKLDLCLQITSPFSNITETAPFPPRRLSDMSIAIHSNSIARSCCERDYGELVEGSSFCDF